MVDLRVWWLWVWVCQRGFVVVMGCGFYGGGGSMGLTRIVAGGGCRPAV